jgi:transcriptional regulator with XRE-family HTH domain
MIVSQRIKELRKEKGLTQEALAKALKISRPALSHYELGTRDVPNDLIPTIAKYFNVTAGYLFGLEN